MAIFDYFLAIFANLHLVTLLVGDDDHHEASYDEDEAINISIVENNLSQDLLCDDVLPYGWYRFLTYSM